MRSARPDDQRKGKPARDLGERRGLRQLLARGGNGCGNREPLDPVEQPIELVAVEIADALRRIEQRARPALRHRADLLQRIAAVVGVGGDHDRDVMIGQRRRQAGGADDIQHHQLDVGVFQQKFDRRVAAHVGRRRQRQHSQPRCLRRAWQPEQPMRRENLALDGETGVLVAEELADQRQVEPLARARRTVQELCAQLRPHRAEIASIEGELRKLRHADAIGAIAGAAGRDVEWLNFHQHTA